MACMNPDGSITESARNVLNLLVEAPRSPEEIARLSGQPLFKVRSSLREMAASDLVILHDTLYEITEKGEDFLTV